jgi:glycine cleavage system T protein
VSAVPEQSLPASAGIVIIGGGVAGTSVAYHLAKLGRSDVVLLDQGPLWETGGSTSHAPGLVFQHNGSAAMTLFARQTVELFGSLGAFHPVGGVEVAATQARWEELHRRHGRAQSFGLPSSLISPEQVRALIPLIDPERILGGFHVATDGIAKALKAAEAMADVAIAAGMRAFGHTEVTGFELERGQVRAVETTRGRIRAGTVVLAAGIWGPKVARLAGVHLPLTPVVHQYAITAPLPELAGETREVAHPLLRHQDADLYFRQVGDRYGIGNYDHEPRLVDAEEIRPWSADGEQPSILPFSPEDFARAAQETARLLPAVGRAERVRSFDGLMSFTPDGMPLIGEAAAARGLWLCEAIWVTHSGGAGKALAELLARGDVRTDLHECDPQRFDAHGLSRTYARARGAQQYREVYDALHPRQQNEQLRPLRRTPLWPVQRDLGAVFFESAGWERPQWFEANAGLEPGDALPRHEWPARQWSPIVAAEHRACRERVGMFDLSPFTKVEVHGPGALAFLQELAANDVDRPIGTIVYTAMCAPRGGIMCDLTITRLADERFLVVTGGAVGRHDIAWMTRHLPWDGSAVLEDKTSALCCIGLWGPRARDVLAALADQDVSNEAFPYMTARDLHVGPVPVKALRISYVGELGWEIYAPVEFGLTLWELLWEAGAGSGVVACGGAAYDSLRLEKGYRLWGQDIDEEHDPYEAGLGWAVRLEKGPFLGRDALAAAKRGVSRRLRCLVTDDPAVVLVGKEPILDGDEAIGYVTSAALGASVGQSILYGYLPVERAEIGTALEVYVEGERHGVTIAAEPLFDPRNERVREVAPAREPEPAPAGA